MIHFSSFSSDYNFPSISGRAGIGSRTPVNTQVPHSQPPVSIDSASEAMEGPLYL